MLEVKCTIQWLPKVAAEGISLCCQWDDTDFSEMCKKGKIHTVMNEYGMETVYATLLLSSP